jgi:hypothetical protein
MQCACAILSSVACPAEQYFSTLSPKRQDFETKKILNIKCVFWFSLYLLSEIFFHYKKNWETSGQKCILIVLFDVLFCVDNVLFYVLFVFVVLYFVLCVNVYYCYRVSTQLQLNISYHILLYHIISHHIILSYHIIFTKSNHFSCKILMKFEFLSTDFIKIRIKFYKNPSSGSRVVPWGEPYRRTDMTKPVVCFRNFANEPKKHCEH